MAAVHGSGTCVLVGADDLTRYFNQGTTSETTQAVNATMWRPPGDAAELTVGLSAGVFTLGGRFDGAGSGDDVDATLAAALGASPLVLSEAFAGLTVGNLARIGSVHTTSYQVRAAKDDIVRTTLQAVCDGGIDWGVSLHDLTEETGTGDGTTVDHGAATTNGGIAHLHATSVIASDVTVTVEHSADGAAWATLATFTDVTAATAERVTIAQGVTVNRYVRASWTFNAGTQATFTVILARR